MRICWNLATAFSLACMCLVVGCGESKPTPTEVPQPATKAEPTPTAADPTTKTAEPATEPMPSDADAKNSTASAKPTATTKEPAPSVTPQGKELPPTKLPTDLLEGAKLTPLNPQGTVLLDFPGKRVLLKTKVCLTRGPLEMFLCLKQTKEHESILSIDSEAYTIHGGLVALGAKEGQPVKFSPEYSPPSGDKIEVFVHWVDTANNLHRMSAQQWIRHSRDRFHEEKFEELPPSLKIPDDSNLRYDPVNKFLIWYGPMSIEERTGLLKLSADKKYRATIHRFYEEGLPRETNADFVFVGSGFSDEAENGKKYLAEGGYVICVANFSTAMIDVAVESSANGTESLSFEAWHERLPPRGSEVLVELIVSKSEKTEAATESK